MDTSESYVSTMPSLEEEEELEVEVEEEEAHLPKPPSKFHYLRSYAIQVAMDQFHDALGIIMKHNYIEEFWLDRKEMTENIFCWSPEDFWSRVQNASISYDVMLSVVRPVVLEKKKMLVDLQEINKYMMGLVGHFMGGVRYDGIARALMLQNALGEIQRKLKREQEANFSQHSAHQLAYLLSNVYRKREMDTLVDPDTSLSMNIEESIKGRYVRRDYSAYGNVLDIGTKEAIVHLENVVKREMRSVEDTRTCYENTMAVNYSEIEVYKSRIAEMNEKLAQHEEIWDSKLLDTKRHLEKIEADFIHYREESERFRVAKEAMMERDRQEALENLKRQRSLIAKSTQNLKLPRKRKAGQSPAKRAK